MTNSTAPDSDQAPAATDQSAELAAPKRRGPPWWGVVLFLALLCGWMYFQLWATTGGPPVQWFNGELDAALAQISDQKPRVFLYLYELGQQAHERNELQVFQQRWARYPLENAICLRIALGNDMTSQGLRKRFDYKNQPLFLLLNRSGQSVGRTEGAVDERQFSTYIGKPILKALGKAAEGDEP